MPSSVLNSERRGSAAIELVAMAPIAALVLLVVIQFAALFTQQVHGVGVASEAASQAVLAWDASSSGRGFRRPCLEEMPAQMFRSGGEPIAIGAGAWRREIDISQEVRLVAGTVCAH